MRNFATLSAALMCSAAMATTASAEKLIIATDFPPTHYVSVQQVEPLMKCITEGTDGAIEFDYFPGGQLVKRDEGIDALNKGLAAFTSTVVPLETAKIPMQSVTMLPGIASSSSEATAAWREALDAGGVLAQEVESVNVKPVSILLLPPYQIGGHQKYDDVADWQGKKVRTTGSALNFLATTLGAVAVEMSATDFYTALQRGTVDATVIGIAAIKSYSIHEVAKEYSRNASLGSSASWIGMNLDDFNKRPAEQQQVIEECGRQAEQGISAWLDEQEEAQIKELESLGATFYDLTPEQLAAMTEAAKPVEQDFVSRLKDRGLPGEEALNEFKAALGK